MRFMDYIPAKNHGVSGRVRAPGAQKATLARLLALCRAIGREGERTGEARWLMEHGRLLQAYAAQSRAFWRRTRLPANGGEARIAVYLRALIREGENAITAEGLMGSMRDLENEHSLTMDEWSLTPEILRVESVRAINTVIREVIETQRSWNRARKWTSTRKPLPTGLRDYAFLEHALTLTERAEDHVRRDELIRHLTYMNLTEAECARKAHERQAMDGLRLNNLLSLNRLLDELDWRKVFTSISGTEKILSDDPGGVYGQMDDESKGVVRVACAQIALSVGYPERTVARVAAEAAGEARGTLARDSVCWWLYEDEGRKQLFKRMRAGNARVPLKTPDPRGTRLIAVSLSAYAIVIGLFLVITRSALFAILALPALWQIAFQIVRRALTRFRRPGMLLRLKMRAVPDEMRTLVTIPALLSGEKRAVELCAQLEAFGCLENDRNIDYLLLGDFADADRQETESDIGIVNAVRERIEQMNRRAGRTKYRYLNRKRFYHRVDGRWMGRERKRGALNALNALLLSGDDTFQAENACAKDMIGRYAFVLTVDADTRMLPGTIRQLIGTIAHPLNRARTENGKKRGYAVIQPRMEIAPGITQNAFMLMLGGAGGVDTYSARASELFQDLCGEGAFGGKGIYDLRAFQKALAGKLPDNAILSHDLIEGILAGTGFAGDITLYEGFPQTPRAYLMRLNRWTRGDWQLLSVCFGKLKIGALGRFRIFINLLGSLATPSQLILILLSFWLANPGMLSAALFSVFMPVLTGGLRGWKSAFTRLTMLPMEARAVLSAVSRTIYRVTCSHRHLLDWVTASDADGVKSGQDPSGAVCALLLIPSLAHPGWILGAAGFAVLFATARARLTALAEESSRARLTSGEYAFLTDVARATWRFFEKHVTPGSNHLPPDNVQIDPPNGEARRTSPTNIGLYLLSCVSAREIGLITDDEAIARVNACAETMEKLEKWHGLLYNWYDIDTLRFLRPGYVSSVDCGNLLACLITCAEAFVRIENGVSCAMRLRNLARDMDFSGLYDENRHLFAIGIDTEKGDLSRSHYDLLASEARILSYAAMMTKGVSVKHWRALGRTSVRTRAGSALLSWSGTMFEYLMPRLLMPSPANSLIGLSEKHMTRIQRLRGQRLSRPWGVSESGYYAFDLNLNYQYRAFGIAELALSGASTADVVSPYAAALALAVSPNEAAANLMRLRNDGCFGEYGFFEAVDYARQEGPRIVKSYMAHHQGMLLCALANTLKDDCLCAYFMQKPEARALNLLLEEKPGARPELKKPLYAEWFTLTRSTDAQRAYRRAARVTGEGIPEAHLLTGSGASVFLTDDGRGAYRMRGICANHWHGDTKREDDRIVPCVKDRSGEVAFDRVVFDAGIALYSGQTACAKYEMGVCVSPEDGAVYIRVRAHAAFDMAVSVTALSALPVALATAEEMRAHPAFMRLSVTSARLNENGILFTRRPREEGCDPIAFAHVCVGAEKLRMETDRRAYMARESAGARFNGHFGAVLDPISAISAECALAAGDTRDILFVLSLCGILDAPLIARRAASPDAFERARMLSTSQAASMLAFIGMQRESYRLLDRASVFFLCPSLRGGPRVLREDLSTSASALWPLGISGDHMLITAHIECVEQLGVVKHAARAHEFYQNAGIAADVVLINEYGNDYAQPVRDAMREAACASRMGGEIGKSGGMYLIEGALLTPAQRAAIEDMSAINACASMDFDACVRAMFGARLPRISACPQPARAGASLAPVTRGWFNGFGGFSVDGTKYLIDLRPGKNTPLAWSNVMANPCFGTLMTERGGGFAWYGNSRLGRLTPYDNDPVVEGWGERLYAVTDAACIPITPGERVSLPYRVTVTPGFTVYECASDGITVSLVTFVDTRLPIKYFLVHIGNTAQRERRVTLSAAVNWLMGTDNTDKRFLKTRFEGGVCVAKGAMPGVGFFSAAGKAYTLAAKGNVPLPEEASRMVRAGGQAACVDVKLPARGEKRLTLLLGWAETADAARALSRAADADSARLEVQSEWDRLLTWCVMRTPEAAADMLVNRFFKYQTLSSRVYGRTGLYQPGGAIGFRDQLQDMLAVLYMSPEIVRGHLLDCAAHQFEGGDVMHWWHPPRAGVRTRISDDLLFLPYLCAKYAYETGDETLLAQKVPYLMDVAIPEGQNDWYGVASETAYAETMHAHCMRAIKRVGASRGVHNLILMGAGDWNDGMNAVGQKGKGESVWLTQFFGYVCRLYARVCRDGEEQKALTALAESAEKAVEESGWDGEWYLRAYRDDGKPIGGAGEGECAIDLITQCWAAITLVNPERAKRAMENAYTQLVERNTGIVKLLDPPFDGDSHPGYIRAYPPGVRENGGQYTHAACWMVMACARLGDANRAWEILRMLLPTSHSRDRDSAARYGCEPYVIAADIASGDENAGRGGWTWYTGAAAWAVRVAYEELIGYRRHGRLAKVCALLPDGWEQAEMTVRAGKSVYTLISERACQAPSLDGQPVSDEIELIDDGKTHTARFPARVPGTAVAEKL